MYEVVVVGGEDLTWTVRSGGGLPGQICGVVGEGRIWTGVGKWWGRVLPGQL